MNQSSQTFPFRRIGSIGEFPAGLRGGVVAIGNFDGVHRGHQAVLTEALHRADASGKPPVMLTFEPHPRAVFTPDSAPPRITPAPMRAEIAKAFGLGAVVEQTFDLQFAGQSAEAFIQSILLDGLGAAHVVTGFDFHFGAKRQGGPAFLMESGERHGFGVTLVDAFRDEDAEVISSSRIRDHLAEGETEAANALLGYRYRVEAEIVRGKQLGRTLGYPTANMQLAADTPLAHGIYAVRFQRADGTQHGGVASFGRRPTVDEDGAPLLETYIFDFDGDLYGETCTVMVCAFLRGEEKFDGLEALVTQMKQDDADARAFLAGMKPLSDLDARLTFATDA